MGPYIGAIVIDINRNISDKPDPFIVAVAFEGEPLLKEEVLKKFFPLDLIVGIVSYPVKFFWISVPQTFAPIDPWFPLMMVFNHDEEGEIFKPVPVLLAELIEKGFFALVFRERIVGPLEQTRLVRHHRSKVAPLGREKRYLCDLFFREETGFHQEFRADQERVSCEGRRTAVRRVPAPLVRGIQGKDLPVFLPRLRKDIGKAGRPMDPGRRCRREREGK